MEELRFNSVFNIIGPVMIGSSSSHTAGVARVGKVAHSISGQRPDGVDIYLYEFFVKTYRGYGTDIVLIGSLLGMGPDDEQLSNSLEIAYEQGMEVCFIPKNKKVNHLNSVKIMASSSDQKLFVTGISIGGGNIRVSELNGFKLSLSMGTPTFITAHQDVSGMTAKVTNILSASDINVSAMVVAREPKGEKATMIIEVDRVGVDDIVM